MPYLSIDEQSSEYYVVCDSYVVNIGAYGALAVQDSVDGNNYYFSFFRITSNSINYQLTTDTTTVSIIEATPKRVRVCISGILSYNSVNMPGLESFSADYVIYDDKIVAHYTVKTDSTSFAIDSNSSNNFLLGFWGSSTYDPNPRIAYENSGVESYGTGSHSAAKYEGVISDTLNVMSITIEDSGLNGNNYALFDYRYHVGWNNTGTLAANSTFHFVGVVLFDSINQNSLPSKDAWVDTDYSVGDLVENNSIGYECISAVSSGDTGVTEPGTGSSWETYWVQCHRYTSSDRLALLDQWTDLTGPAIADSLGAPEADWNIPLTLDSTGMASDGTQRLEYDGDSTIKITADRDRVKHAVVLEPRFLVGDPSSPTALQIEYFKFDDNAVSSSVVATVGNNATWEDSSGSGYNTENSDVSSDITKDGGLDTVGSYHVECSVTVYDNAFFKQGTIDIKFTPQFGYDAASDQTLWNLYIDSSNQIQIVYDAGNDRYELRVVWGGTTTTLNGTAFTENVSLQQPTVLHAAWDSDKDALYFSRNGQDGAVGVNTGTPSASGASYVCIGAQSDGDGTTSLNADAFLDECRAKDSCIVHFGSFFVDEGNGYANPHEDVTFCWDGSDTLSIGSGSVTSVGDYSTDGPLGTKAFNPTASTGYATAITSGNISAVEGSLQLWVSDLDTLTADSTLFYGCSTFKVWWDYSATALVFTYGSSTVSSAAISDGNFHHVKIEWEDSARITIIVDGVEVENTSSISSAPTLDSNMYFNADDASGTNLADVLTSNWQITSKVGTPQIWTALGHGPLLLPQLEIT